ncbi:MAG: universal stress protein [Desulfoferrobacter sp.]
MRILFAGDEHTYSAFALKKVVSLAMNTWADVTLLALSGDSAAGSGAGPDLPDGPQGSTAKALNDYRGEFLAAWDGIESPYTADSYEYRWMPLKNGLWEQVRVCQSSRKELRTRLRTSSTANEILAEAAEGGSDLIVIGCSGGAQCSWAKNTTVPQKVVTNATCSVLLVKEDLPVKKITACIDQNAVSQESLEMINQMVTIHNADLELVGLTKGGGVHSDTYSRLMQVGDYYSDRGIEAKTHLTEISEFEKFVAAEPVGDLFALWLGKKSLLDRFFPRDWVGRFVNSCHSSVLVLR